MEQTLGMLSVRVDKLERDTGELFSRVNSSAVTLASVNEKLSSMLTTLGEVKQAVAALQQKPGRRLETVTASIITALASAIIGYFLAKFQ